MLLISSLNQLQCEKKGQLPTMIAWIVPSRSYPGGVLTQIKEFKYFCLLPGWFLYPSSFRIWMWNVYGSGMERLSTKFWWQNGGSIYILTPQKMMGICVGKSLFDVLRIRDGMWMRLWKWGCMGEVVWVFDECMNEINKWL